MDPLQKLYVVGHLHRFGYAEEGTFRRGYRIERIDQMGFRGTRLAFEWSQLEPLPQEFSWARQDSIIAELSTAGLEFYGMIGYSPVWARPEGARFTHRPLVQGSTALGDAAFASFAATVARRYAAKVRRWEVWNEPNCREFWQNVATGADTGPDPKDYLTLYELARDSILAVDPNARVATAGLAAGAPDLDACVDDQGLKVIPAHIFLSGLLSAGASVEYVAIHPYTHPSSDLSEDVRYSNWAVDSVRAVLEDHGRKDLPLWVTEWGVPESDALSTQALDSWFTNGLAVLMCDPKVDVVTVYALTEGRTASTRMALIAPDGQLTTRGVAILSLLENWTGCPSHIPTGLSSRR